MFIYILEKLSTTMTRLTTILNEIDMDKWQIHCYLKSTLDMTSINKENDSFIE